MLDALFSFRGRLSRLQYLGWWLGSIGLIVLAVVIAFFSFGVGWAATAKVSQPGWGSLLAAGLVAILFMLGLLVVCFWIGLALATKRIRDIGWNPLLVIGGIFLFSIVDMVVLSRLLGGIGPKTYGGGGSVIGLLVNLTYMAVLFFWPSASDGEQDPGEPLREAPVIAAAAPRPVMRQSPSADRAANSACAPADFLPCDGDHKPGKSRSPG